MKRRGIAFTAVLILLQLCCSSLWARPTTARRAEKAVIGWLKADAQPLGKALGRQIKKVETFTDEDGEPIYYIVCLQVWGFVIVPADDLVEPIIGFVDGAGYDPSPENPLGALVTNDLNGRIAAARDARQIQASAGMKRAAKSQAKWKQLESLADGASITGLPSISDVRVEPLVQSKWNQLHDGYGNDCYNYYTPNNYRCGCVATAMAQVMRYHEYPTTGIGVHTFEIKVDGSSQNANTRGGDGSGGVYNWSEMVFEPENTTPTQRQAIGALCYDAGVSVNMKYGSSVSTADTRKTKDALTTIFLYANAIKGYNDSNNIGPGLIAMINPNLDAKGPVILGIKNYSTGKGHAVVCDGYGYNSSTLYHHLNMGWAGDYDAWYNLPNINSSPAYTSVYKCVYNIRADAAGDGEMISGRVFESNGNPIVYAAVYARTDEEPPVWIPAESDSKGIYAFDNLESNKTYIVRPFVEGYVFESQTIAMGTSSNNSGTSGNVWGIDFVGFAGDLDGDGCIDLHDLAVLALAWQSIPGDSNWNPVCDISDPKDDVINERDLGVVMDNWLADAQ